MSTNKTDAAAESNPLWTPPVRRGKRWVDAEIARLDPEKDYARIVSLIANYKMNEMVMNLNYGVGFMSNVMPKGGTDVVRGTGKAEKRPQSRYYNTTDPFWTWFFYGPNHSKTRKTIEHVNRYHGALYEKYPDSFREHDDWMIAAAMFTIGADRMRAAVGAPPQHPHVQVAFHHFWRDILNQITTMDGTVPYPDTYQKVWDFAKDFESRPFPPTPDGEILFNAFVGQLQQRCFPKKSVRWTRNLMLTFIPETVRKRHGLTPPDKLAVWFNKKVWRLMFFALDHLKPDNAVPMIEVLESEASQQLRQKMLAAERPSHSAVAVGAAR